MIQTRNLPLLLSLFSLASASAWAQAKIVISQVYGGGGSNGTTAPTSTYQRDYVELFNAGTMAQNISGWTLKYSSATGTGTWSTATLPNVTIDPGRYLLVVLGNTGTAGAVITGDASSTSINMGQSDGKIALLNANPTISGACPTNAALVDFVAYGTVNCSEGSATGTTSAPATFRNTGDVRNSNGCADTDNNSADFTLVTSPVPRTSASPANLCTGGGGSTNPSASGSASPNPVIQGNQTTFTANVTPGTNPASTGITVNCNLSTIGGASSFNLPLSSGSVYTANYNVPAGTAANTYSLPCTVADAQSRSGAFNISLTVQAAAPTIRRIFEITGPGTASPLAGQSVTTRGIVTAIRGTTGSTKGFYIQSQPSDVDSDPATSEGLLIFVGSGSIPACATVGNLIQIDGTVLDFVSSTSPVGSVPLTELASPANCQVLSTGNPLPAPVTLTTSNLTASGSATQARRFLSMLVTLPSAVVVAPSLGNVTEANATAVSTGVFFATFSGVPRAFRGPGILDTRRPNDALATVPAWNGNPQVLRVDVNGLTGGTTLELTPNSTIASINGVMDFSTSQGQYQIFSNAAGLGSVTVAPISATPIPAPLATDLTIANFNIERFFNDANDGNGAPVLTTTAFNGRLNKLSLAVRNVLRLPDIIVLQEVEGPRTLPAAFPVPQSIVNKINADAVAAGLPNPNYNWCEFVTNDVGAIAIAILFKQSRVTITDCAQFGLNTLYTTPSGASDTLNDRPPVVFRGTITAPGSDSPFAFRVIGNHLRSLNGVDEPGASNGDRVRAKRNEQARYLGRLASGNLAEQTVNWSQTENLIVSGDMNAFEFSDGYGDSLGCIGGGPAPANQIYTTAAQSAVSPACTAITGLNLFNVTTGDGSQRYTFQFSGSLQRLDHILVNSLVAPRVRQFAYGRNNADFPEGPTYRSDFNRSERVSDHDIPVVYVQLPVEVTSRTRVNASPIVWNRVTNRYNGTISVTNTGAAALSGPIYVFFRNLPAGVTLPDLPQSGGAPYLTINGPLAPGATSSAVNISFAVVNNARISYTTQRFNGSF